MKRNLSHALTSRMRSLLSGRIQSDESAYFGNNTYLFIFVCWFIFILLRRIGMNQQTRRYYLVKWTADTVDIGFYNTGRYVVNVRVMWICANTFREGIAEFTRKLGTCKNCIRVNCVNILGRLLEQNANICRECIRKTSMNNDCELCRKTHYSKSQIFV